MITQDQVTRAVRAAWLTAIHTLPPDILASIEDASQEGTGLARDTYRFFLEQYHVVQETGQNAVCNDSGSIYFFVTIGDKAQFAADVDWWKAFRDVTTTLTRDEEILKPTAGDPLFGRNPNTNTGIAHPFIDFNVAHGFDGVEITVVGKGGGAEVYSNYQMLMPHDGIEGVKKFVLDSVLRGAVGGKMCPPNIIGVGIGGPATVSMQHAFQAATLRPVGSRHPLPWVAELEDTFTDALNMLEYGPLGNSGGKTVLDVHLEVAWGSVVNLPVSFIPQCVIAHRASVQLYGDGRAEPRPHPEYWFQESRRSIADADLGEMAVR